jgi:hypothetical protein
MTNRAKLSERIANGSFLVISSPIPPNVSLDEWRQTRPAAKPFKSTRLRLLIEALHVTPSHKRKVA